MHSRPLGWGDGVMRRALTALGLACAVGLPGSLTAQDDWIGVAVGTMEARFDGPATVDFTNRRGWAVGVFADIASPLRPIDLRIEGRWVRRGGDESTGGGGAESDLLSIPLGFGPRIHLGPVALFPFVGVELAYPLANRRSSDIEVGFENPSSIEFGGFLGGAIDVRAPAGLRVGLEARLLRGFGGSFDGLAGQLDLRATEFTLRLARPLN